MLLLLVLGTLEVLVVLLVLKELVVFICLWILQSS